MTDVTLTNAPTPPSNDRTALWIGYGLGALALPGCFIIAVQMGGERWLNILVCIFGSIVGWSFGMLISPYPGERRQFSEFRKAISAFVGGFVLAKIDPLFAGAGSDVPGTTLLLGRVLLFATTFLLCLQFTYVKRSYWKTLDTDAA